MENPSTRLRNAEKSMIGRVVLRSKSAKRTRRTIPKQNAAMLIAAVPWVAKSTPAKEREVSAAPSMYHAHEIQLCLYPGVIRKVPEAKYCSQNTDGNVDEEMLLPPKKRCDDAAQHNTKHGTACPAKGDIAKRCPPDVGGKRVSDDGPAVCLHQCPTNTLDNPGDY